jgi:hypothetical protein
LDKWKKLLMTMKSEIYTKNILIIMNISMMK